MRGRSSNAPPQFPDVAIARRKTRVNALMAPSGLQDRCLTTEYVNVDGAAHSVRPHGAPALYRSVCLARGFPAQLLLFGSFLCRGQRSRAFPRVIGNVEHHAVGSVKLRLVECLHIGRPPRETIGAKLLQLLGVSINVVHQHAEVMDAAEVEARPLIPAEPQDRETDGAVAEEYAIRGALAPGLRPVHFHEIERLLVELGGGVRVFRRKGDVTKLRHCCLLQPVWQRGRTTITPSVTEPRAVAAVNVPSPSRERAQ